MVKAKGKIGKRIISLFMAIVMLCSVMPVSSAEVTTNEDGYIEVDSVEDLYLINQDLSANYILTSDIDLTASTAVGGDWDFDGRGWNPIGSNNVYGDNAFSGIFDGNGHKITGMRIDVLDLPAGVGSRIYVGLFASVSGTVKNLSISGTINVNHNVTSSSLYVGSISGYCSGNIYNCSNETVIDTSSPNMSSSIGGIVGCIESGEVKNSYNKAEIRAEGSVKDQTDSGYVAVGGIAGYSNGGNVNCCYNNGKVIGTSGDYTSKYVSSNVHGDPFYSYYYIKAYSAGIVGLTQNGTIKDCYNAETISSLHNNDRKGGALFSSGISNGDTAEISSCYNISNIIKDNSINGYAIGNGIVSNCYYLQNCGTETNGAKPLTSGQMLSDYMYSGFDFESIWTQNKDAVYPYPQLADLPQDLRTINKLEIVSLPTKTEYNYGEVFNARGCTISVEIDGNKEIVNVTSDMVSGYNSTQEGKQTLTISYFGHTLSFEVTVNEKTSILIYTIEDLYNIRNNLTESYILMNNIDLTEATAIGGDWDFMGNGWNPIGSNNVYSNGAFSGVFDGNGYEIKGLNMNITSLPSGTETVYVGLFANVTGVVKNLKVSGNISYKGNMSFYIGSVAGTCSGIIENCTNNANVDGIATSDISGYVGGIAGNLSGKAQIICCANKGNVTSYCYEGIYNDYNYAGGIAGNGSTASIISKCYNTGNVSARSTGFSGSSRNYYGEAYASGISYTGNISDSYNTGDVKAFRYASYGRTYACGIGGTAKNCYNIGMVTGDNCRYGISNNTSINCYYLSGTGDSSTGAASLNYAQMLLSSMYSGFDFESIWVQNKAAVYPYPQLLVLPQDLRVVYGIEIASLPTKTVYDYGEPFSAEGCTINMQIEGGRERIIVTNDMVSGYNAYQTGTQTITVTYLGKTTTFSIYVRDKISVPIYTIEELYNIREDLTGSYILMNDIDLTEATATDGGWDFMGNGWNPIGSNNIYSNEAFSGEFDGNGHEIKGLNINITSLPSGTETVYVGLFANVTGVVKNLKVSGNINYKGNKSFYIGSIAGTCSGTIENCINSANVGGIANTDDINGYVGGIAGNLSDKAQIICCANKGNVSSYCFEGTSSYSDYDYNYAGGIAGNGSTASIISKCYNTGNVSARSTGSSSDYGEAYAAGILKTGNISDSYNTGDVKAFRYASYGHTYAYGIGGTVKNCYNIGMVTGDNCRYGISNSTSVSSYYLDGTGSSSTGASALTESQMKLKSMFVGFDFDKIWTINSYANHPYPQLTSNIQDMNETVNIIRFIAIPSKKDYFVGDNIDLSGGIIEAVYISGKSELINITEDMITGFDSSTIGEKIITVSFEGQALTYAVNVTNRPTVIGIELISEPNKKEYLVGEQLDFEGAKIEVFYDNNTSDILDVKVEMTEGANSNVLGEQTVTVALYGFTDSFKITVSEIKATSIKIQTLPQKLVYVEGEMLDTTGLVISVQFNDGRIISVTSGYAVTGYSSEKGIHTITVEYLGLATTFDVEVIAKNVISIELRQLPDKVEYFEGEQFDKTGIILVAIYDNEDIEIVEDYIVSGYDGTVGIKAITLEYAGYKVSFTVKVKVKVMTRLYISQYPAKINYIENEALDTTGLIVKAEYNNGSVEIVKGYEIVGFSSNPGSHTITIVYEGMTTSYNINVVEKTLQDIRVTLPTKQTYLVGEAFDSTGMVVTAYYDNGSEISVDDYVMTGFESDTPGVKTIVVTYENMTRSFVVVVHERSNIETGGNMIVGDVIGRVGANVVVPVSVTKNTGIAGFTHTIKFDTNLFEFVSVSAAGDFAEGTIVLNDEEISKGIITILWYGDNDVIGDGEVYNIVFKVSENADECISNISILFSDNGNANTSGENVLFGKMNGSVQILSYWLGDLNGDREIAMLDLLKLAQYVAGKELTLTDKQLLSADVNEDGIIDIHDVVMLNQWLLDADM